MGFIFLRHKSDNGSFTQRARNSPNLQEDTNWVAGYFLGWVGVRHFSIKIFFPKGRGGKVKSAQVCGVGFAIVFFGLLFGELRRSQPGPENRPGCSKYSGFSRQGGSTPAKKRSTQPTRPMARPRGGAAGSGVMARGGQIGFDPKHIPVGGKALGCFLRGSGL